jgi:hypothetical protein
VPILTPAAQIALLIALGMADLIPDIAHAAEARGHAAAMRDDDAEAERWIGLSEAADDALPLALTAIEAEERPPIKAPPIVVAAGCDRVFVE